MESLEALALISERVKGWKSGRVEEWKSGRVEEEVLIRNEYMAAENEILKSKLNGTMKFNDAERIKLAKIGKRMVKKIDCCFHFVKNVPYMYTL